MYIPVNKCCLLIYIKKSWAVKIAQWVYVKCCRLSLSLKTHMVDVQHGRSAITETQLYLSTVKWDWRDLVVHTPCGSCKTYVNILQASRAAGMSGA